MLLLKCRELKHFSQVLFRLLESLSDPKMIHSEVEKLFRTPQQLFCQIQTLQTEEDAAEEENFIRETTNTEDISSTSASASTKEAKNLKFPAKTESRDQKETKETVARCRVNTLDLTGYKVRSGSKDLPNFQTGSGKISSALGKFRMWLISVTILCYFWKVSISNFLVKVAEIFHNFCSYFEKHHFLCKICYYYFLANLVKHWATFCSNI